MNLNELNEIVSFHVQSGFHGNIVQLRMDQRALPTVPAHPRCQFCKQRQRRSAKIVAEIYRKPTFRFILRGSSMKKSCSHICTEGQLMPAASFGTS